jgi:hypothetical protein
MPRTSIAPQLVRKQSVTSTGDPFLDPNHTHFILVDDGSDSQFGKEIEFRAHLENELRKGKSLKYYQQKRAQNTLSIAGKLNPMIETEEEETKESVPV